MTTFIDDILKDWGERIFYPPVRGRMGKRTVTHFKTHSSPKPLKQVGSARIRNALSLTTRKTPEVMVKISGGGKGMQQIKAHFDYISRNGRLSLENEHGQIIAGREAISDLRIEWKCGQYGIPEEARYKEAFNVVLSMPPGTDRDSVAHAARAFASTEFGDNHAYVFVAHDDERHPHVHLCIKALGFDGTRLNPRKADLQQWRERFAEALRDRGVAANATPRTARFAGQRTQKQAIQHMRKRENAYGEAAHHEQPEKFQDSFSVKKQTAHAYGQIARVLAKGDPKERQLALDITRYVAQMPVFSVLREKVQRLREPHVERTETPAPQSRTDHLDRPR